MRLTITEHYFADRANAPNAPERRRVWKMYVCAALQEATSRGLAPTKIDIRDRGPVPERNRAAWARISDDQLEELWAELCRECAHEESAQDE